MKWIGQHIWDFISRFRSDVYLENVAEPVQDHVVGIDADGKLYKQDVSTGDITGVTAGDALTGGGTSGAVTINHEDTSSQASVNNSGSTYIQDVTLDTYGHVTGLTSAAIPTLNQDTTGTAATVTGAAQTNITSVGTLTNLDVDNININGDTITASADLSIVATGNDIAIDTDNLVIESTTDGKPFVELKSRTNSSNGSVLQFTSDKGAAGTDDDSIGSILFVSDDDHPLQQQTNYAQIIGKISDASNTDEAGKLEFQVAESDGTTTQLTTGLLIEGEHATDGEVDVTIAAGTGSTTTVAGNLAAKETTVTNLITSGNIELGHATDTTIARDSAGVVTVQGKTVALGTELAGHNDNVIIKQVKVTLSQSDVNSLHTTPVNLVSAQGANTIIVFMQAIMRVTHAANQTNAACDMAFHYDGQEPGVNFSESVMFLRRFNYSELDDRTYNLMAITNAHIAQNLTDPVNKALEVSLDSAATNNCTNGVDIWLTYYVIDIS